MCEKMRDERGKKEIIPRWGSALAQMSNADPPQRIIQEIIRPML